MIIIVCKKCKQEVSAGNLLGHLVAKGVQYVGPFVIAYYVQMYNLQTRKTWSEELIGYLVGTADSFEIPCSVCEKYKGWITIDNNIESLPLEKEVEKQSEL